MPLETSSLSLGELQISSKGAKQIPLHSSGEPLTWRPGPLRVQWEPKAFNDPDASRVAICFQSTDAVANYMQQLEGWVLKTLAPAPKRYFC